MRSAPLTVVETPEFLTAVKHLLSDDERSLLVDYLADNPTAGALVAGTGGIRKLRWGLAGRGKRSGARVVYYYHDDAVPLFLLTAYAKNERADLSQADRNAFRRLTALLIDAYQRRSNR